jgi:hypothetical protein
VVEKGRLPVDQLPVNSEKTPAQLYRPKAEECQLKANKRQGSGWLPDWMKLAEAKN